MKLTTFLTTSLLLSLSHLISATELVDQSTDVLEKVYVNAAGDVVIPEVFHWGRPAVKEKDAAKPRVCGGKLDASGRLGKRQATCPTGYSIACDAYSANPCCPNSSPICCNNASVCCGTGQFCQGTSTCCNAGQIGCGEACCNYGETCCGSNCCGAGFTCSNGTCVAPSGSPSVVPTTLPSASVTSTSELSRVATGTSTVVVPITSTASQTSSATCSEGGGDGNGNSNSNSNSQYNGPSASTVGGAVGGSLSALSTALAAVAAWFYRKKNQAEAALAAAIAPKPVEEKSCEPTPPPSTIAKEELAAYETPNENTWIERPITGTPGIAGHGSAYM